MKKIRILFITAVMLVLVGGLARALFLPEEINTYENRYANQMPVPTVSTVMDGTFQDGVDAALMDQLPLSETMKRTYNQATASFLKGAIDLARQTAGIADDHYVEFNGLRLFGDDYVTYWPRAVWSVETELNAKIDSPERYLCPVSRFDLLPVLHREGHRPGL